MSGRVRKLGGRVLTLGLSLSLLGGLLSVIPVEAAGPAPKKVEPLGVKGQAPEPELERPKGIFENEPAGLSGKQSGPGVLDPKDKAKGVGRLDPESTVVEEMTTETNRVIRNKEGALNAIVTAGPVRMKDQQGKWQAFDLSLERGAGGRLRTKMSPVQVGIRDDQSPKEGPRAELEIAKGKTIGIDFDVVKETSPSTTKGGKPIDDPTTKGYSEQAKAKVQALAAMPTKEPGEPATTSTRHICTCGTTGQRCAATTARRCSVATPVPGTRTPHGRGPPPRMPISPPTPTPTAILKTERSSSPTSRGSGHLPVGRTDVMTLDDTAVPTLWVGCSRGLSGAAWSYTR